jgi:bifunctional non-homologous end joining protein LigD
MGPLKSYRSKRNFTSSPEPTGDEKKARKKSKGLVFCVQKHLASHLHYDLRLEHHGVLLSWAVPKGPSLDPSIKRFAQQVEDHPIAYGDFEGVIPDGYGAGVVMLWDSGTWIPESPDVEATLAKGDLKFRLDGYKLKGSWVLVRTRGYARQGEKPSGPSWLLIKHRDEWSGDLDIAEFAPLSVKTGDDFPAIMAAQDPALWLTNRRSAKSATGAMLQEVIKQAAELKLSELQEQEQEQDPPPAPRQRRARKPKT